MIPFFEVVVVVDLLLRHFADRQRRLKIVQVSRVELQCVVAIVVALVDVMLVVVLLVLRGVLVEDETALLVWYQLRRLCVSTDGDQGWDLDLDLNVGTGYNGFEATCAWKGGEGHRRRGKEEGRAGRCVGWRLDEVQLEDLADQEGRVFGNFMYMMRIRVRQSKRAEMRGAVCPGGGREKSFPESTQCPCMTPIDSASSLRHAILSRLQTLLDVLVVLVCR